jgi:hypothetical protein
MRTRLIRWAGHLALMGDEKCLPRFWFEMLRKRRPLGILKRGWENSIKMDLREIGLKDME